MAWFTLFIAIIFEVVGTTAVKLSDGFTKWGPIVVMYICYGVSFFGLSIAVKQIELGMAYAIWAGLGTAIIVGVGVFYFGETFTWLKALSISLIILGVVGLKLADTLIKNS